MVVEREFGRMILKPLSPSPLLLGCGEFDLIRGAPWLPTTTWGIRRCSHIIVFAVSTDVSYLCPTAGDCIVYTWSVGVSGV